MKKSIILILALVLFSNLHSQTLRGTIKDIDTGQALVGATISLDGTQWGTVSDSLGIFRLEKLPVGRYQLRVSYLGYAPLIVPEILIESGRETVLNLQLTETGTDLNAVTVRARQADRRIYAPTVQTLTIEETLRFPATFFDPARLTTAYPGVVGNNDQTNGISVRGHSPNHLRWRLEGVDIVNPNHTPNAGTFSDRVTQNGGGVNILSAQLLGPSHFYISAFPAEYGNALGAVLDMQLRRGNNQQREWTLQAGLIGLELAGEGPINSKKGSSYLVNYRYSTAGLIQAMGVDFGDEAINYQDLSFHLAFPLEQGGQFTVFGVGGLSSNVFEAQRDPEVWEFSKDRFDIDFSSKMGALGASLELFAGKRGVWKNSLAISALESSRTGDRLNDNLQAVFWEEDILNQRKISLHSAYHYKLNTENRLRFGIMLNQEDFNIQSELATQGILASGDTNGWLWQPYFSWQSFLSPKLNLNAGLHFTYFGLNGSNALEPRFSLEWGSNDHRISAAYGLHSQTQAPQLYFAQTGGTDNKELELTKAHHLGLAYQYALSDFRQLEIELFYQQLFDVPVTIAPSSFSALNLIEQFITSPLANTGEGQNYGLAVNLQQKAQSGIYYLLNGTFYESLYTGSDGIERDTRFNANVVANATFGKEWTRTTRKEKVKITGLNGRLTYSGGFRDTPIDVGSSTQTGTTVYLEDQAFSIQQDPYFRLDLRLYIKWNKTGRNNTLSLDIQNATNQENTAFSYYDTQQKMIVEKKQLGIIPILTYRAEFGKK